MQNAGLRLWEVQKHQGTGLCVGIDPHYDPGSHQNNDFYRSFKMYPRGVELKRLFQKLAVVLDSISRVRPVSRVDLDRDDCVEFLAGMTEYYLQVIDAAWECGIRVFKPQIAFFERFNPYGIVALQIVCNHLHELARISGEMIFLILDAKRGDIDTTQLPYYHSYLADFDQVVFPGSCGRFNFDVMTVTTWMGEDVLTPGLPYFLNGKGAVVVTRTSNPSGTALQDLTADVPFWDIKFSERQTEFVFSGNDFDKIWDLVGGHVFSVHEVMLYLTEKFSRQNNLDQDGVSPLFSVMGSTVKMTDSFRKIRPNGIALIPGFGAQGGAFKNVLPLLVRKGTLDGHLGILASSREHNFPWMKKYGGSGDPGQLRGEMHRAIDNFRATEKQAYEAAGATWPF